MKSDLNFKFNHLLRIYNSFDFTYEKVKFGLEKVIEDIQNLLYKKLENKFFIYELKNFIAYLDSKYLFVNEDKIINEEKIREYVIDSSFSNFEEKRFNYFINLLYNKIGAQITYKKLKNFEEKLWDNFRIKGFNQQEFNDEIYIFSVVKWINYFHNEVDKEIKDKLGLITFLMENYKKEFPIFSERKEIKLKKNELEYLKDLYIILPSSLLECIRIIIENKKTSELIKNLEERDKLMMKFIYGFAALKRLKNNPKRKIEEKFSDILLASVTLIYIQDYMEKEESEKIDKFKSLLVRMYKEFADKD